MSAERHKYEYNVTLIPDSASARVVRMVGENKRVLEIGSGPGSITKYLATTANCQVTALDIDIESLKKVAAFCERTYQADLNNSAWSTVFENDSKFDVLIAADVLEHVYEPASVLEVMKELLNNDGYMVISLPHIGHAVIHACLLNEDFDYGDTGLLDRTHVRFFGIKNMQQLFENAGLKIVQAEFVVRNPEHTEFSKCWAKTSSALRELLTANPFGLVYQVIIKAVPITANGNALNLMDIAVTPQRPTVIGSVKAFLRLYLSAGLYKKLRNLHYQYF